MLKEHYEMYVLPSYFDVLILILMEHAQRALLIYTQVSDLDFEVEFIV